MENYEQKYKEALEIARKINSGEGVAAPKGWSMLEVIFPELKESEDERIKKEIIAYLDVQEILTKGKDIDFKKWIIWLLKMELL